MSEETDEEEIDWEEIHQVIILTRKILSMISEEPDPTVPIRALTSSLTFLVCNGPETRQEATEAVDYFCNAVKEAIDKAEEFGVASWSRGTIH
jgi:hypothetical protein